MFSIAVIAALAAGLGVGALLHGADPAAPQAAGARVAAAVGALWLDALRMTILPLIVALMITAVAAVTDAAATGRTAGRALMLFGVLVTVAALYAVAVTPALLALWPFEAEAARAFADSAPPAGDELSGVPPPTLARFLENLAPSNVVRAAAEDSILQIVVFAIAFGFAVTRLPEAQRAALTGFFGAVAEAMTIIVRWVLKAAPVGVFGLALGVGMTTGVGAAAVLAQYALIVSAVTLGIALFAFVVGCVFARVGPLAFARAAGPVWAVAASTQSSVASLPVMVQRLEDGLAVSPRTAGLVLPLAVTLFRVTSPVANLSVAFVIAALYGIEPTPAQIAAAVFTALAVSVGTVGLPGTVSFFASMAPICLALGVPLEVLAILLAVEVIPDIFRTLGNVTGHMAATVIVDRMERRAGQGG